MIQIRIKLENWLTARQEGFMRWRLARQSTPRLLQDQKRAYDSLTPEQKAFANSLLNSRAAAAGSIGSPGSAEPNSGQAKPDLQS